MSITKTLARKIVFPIVHALQLEKILASLSFNNKMVLVYHGVVEKPDHNTSVGPIALNQFQKHLDYYKENFDVISLSEIFEMYRAGFKPRRKTIALTFDDGYENNYTHVAPALKQYNFPGTFFIISQCLEDEYKLTWYDHIDFIKSSLDVSKIDSRYTRDEQLISISALKEHIKSLNIEQRKALYAELNKIVAIDDRVSIFPREHWKLMNKKQLSVLASNKLFEIAAHTHNHPNLGLISKQDAKEEVLKCKSLLENAFQQQVVSIAFPDGSYTDDVKKICVEAGYNNLLAVEPKCSSDVCDRNILPRYCISSTTTFESNMFSVSRNFSKLGF